MMDNGVNFKSNENLSAQWSQWASLAQSGDKMAYAALLRSILPYIKGRLAGSLSNPEWADDIAQEVLISVHKSLHTYDPQRPFKSWLGAIIGFRRSDYLRKHYNQRKHSQTSLEDPAFIKGYVTDPAYAGELKDIETFLQGLPQVQRDVFQMMRIDGYTSAEIAQKTGMNESAVKVSIHRTQKKLLKHMKE